MIYTYEETVLKFLNIAIKDLKMMTYASDLSLVSALSQIKQYPCMYYSRDASDTFANKRICQVVELDGQICNLVPFTQHYTAQILCETQAQAFLLATQLRSHWNKCSFVVFDWADQGTIKVQLRLEYIKVTDIRLPNDVKGACRAVEFKWWSNLVLPDIDPSNFYNLVEDFDFKIVAIENKKGETVEVETYTIKLNT